MSVRVTTLEELPESLQPQVGALDWLDNAPPFETALLRSVRAAGAPLSDYLALVAVEGSEVLARVGVERPCLTTRRGTERFCGIVGV